MKLTWSIFPKFFKHLSVDQLAGMIAETGLDTTNLVIRDGYWVELKTLAQSVPAFVKAMDSHGLKVHFATAGFSPSFVCENPDSLQILSDNGIKEFRMSYFRQGDMSAAQALQKAREELEQMIPVCEKAHIKAVYQLHHGTLIPNSFAVHKIIDGLPSKHIGVMLDPGNQAWEGWENWDRALDLLGDYACSFGIKDTLLIRNAGDSDSADKGWKRDWCSCAEGTINWHEVFGAIKNHAFEGTLVFMPFYHSNNPDKLTKTLKQEVAYLRNVCTEVTHELEVQHV